MNLDDYRDRMAAAHQQFQHDAMAMLRSYSHVQTVWTQTLVDVSRHIHELEETITELKALVLEQGQQLTALRTEVHALRERLNGQ